MVEDEAPTSVRNMVEGVAEGVEQAAVLTTTITRIMVPLTHWPELPPPMELGRRWNATCSPLMASNTVGGRRLSLTFFSSARRVTVEKPPALTILLVISYAPGNVLHHRLKY